MQPIKLEIARGWNMYLFGPVLNPTFSDNHPAITSHSIQPLRLDRMLRNIQNNQINTADSKAFKTAKAALVGLNVFSSRLIVEVKARLAAVTGGERDCGDGTGREGHKSHNAQGRPKSRSSFPPALLCSCKWNWL